MAPLPCENTSAAWQLFFSQLGLEPNHTGWTAQALFFFFFLEESCRVKRSDTQTFFKILKLLQKSSDFFFVQRLHGFRQVVQHV